MKTFLLALVPVAFVIGLTLTACGTGEPGEELIGSSHQELIRSPQAIGDKCTVDGKDGTCKTDNCSQCTVEGMCYQWNAKFSIWQICLKPFPSSVSY